MIQLIIIHYYNKSHNDININKKLFEIELSSITRRSSLLLYFQIKNILNTLDGANI